MSDDIFDITDDELREIHRAIEQKTLRLEHPLALDLIRVLVKVKQAPRIYVLDMVRANREKAVPID
jgi:hypothetical protein